VADNILDLLHGQDATRAGGTGVAARLGLRGGPSLAQRAMETRAVARLYERGARATLVGLRGQARLDRKSEHLLLRSILAPPAGLPVLDLSCGTGTHALQLAHREDIGPVLGIDRSLPMLHEASHHLVEAGAVVDLIRADAQAIPLHAGTMGAVLDVGALHLYPNVPAVLREVARILSPGGSFACATLLPDRPLLDRLEATAGVQRRDEASLRRLCEAAGLEEFERVLLPPWIVFRVQKPREP
jgi:SAM-dependent methyltransferase